MNTNKYEPSRLQKIVTATGLNPYASSGFGSGMADGLCMGIDPLGVIAQYVGQRLKKDIRTIGGLGFFGTSNIESKVVDNEGKTVRNKDSTLSSLFGKVLIGAGCYGCYANPKAIKYMLMAQGITSVINLCANLKRKRELGTLEKQHTLMQV